MKTERSYRQLAAIVEQQAHAIADALLELDTAAANLPDEQQVNLDAAVAAIARAKARLRGDQLHTR